MNDVCVEYLIFVKSYFSENEAFTNRLYNLAIQVLKKNQKYGSLGAHIRYIFAIGRTLFEDDTACASWIAEFLEFVHDKIEQVEKLDREDLLMDYNSTLDVLR